MRKRSSIKETSEYLRTNLSITIGLILGQASSIIGVDVDGEDALSKNVE